MGDISPWSGSRGMRAGLIGGVDRGAMVYRGEGCVSYLPLSLSLSIYIYIYIYVHTHMWYVEVVGVYGHSGVSGKSCARLLESSGVRHLAELRACLLFY